MGTAGPHPGCRSRTGAIGNQGQRSVSRTHRHTHAGLRDTGTPRRTRALWADRSADGGGGCRRVPGVRPRVVHHGFRTRRRRRTDPADRITAVAKTLSVGIIGAGPGGLSLGIFLRKAGFEDFTIFDREDGVGGTWRINTYPGLACDVKSHLYSYSFDLNANWSRLWSGQAEILDYFERCAQRYRLAQNLTLNTEIVSAHWAADATAWQLTTSTGEQYHFDIVVSA